MNKLVFRITCAFVMLWAVHVQAATDKPNILIIWGDDVGYWNVSHNNRGMMGYMTPNIDRIAEEGLSFTDYYGEQSCTAGRAAREMDRERKYSTSRMSVNWPLFDTAITRCTL